MIDKWSPEQHKRADEYDRNQIFCDRHPDRFAKRHEYVVSGKRKCASCCNTKSDGTKRPCVTRRLEKRAAAREATKILTVIIFLLVLAAPVFAWGKHLKPAQVTFDKFKNVSRISTDLLEQANAGKVTFEGKDGSILVYRVELTASLICDGNVEKCSPKTIELLFVGDTRDWSMKCDHVDFLVDGQPETIKASWDGQVLSGDDLREYIDTNPSPELLVKIANAKTVDVRIGVFDFSLSDTAIAMLKDLVTHIDGVALAPSAPATPPQASAAPTAPDKLAIDRKAFLDAINAPGRKGHGEIVGDTLTLHTAECNKQNFDLLVANPHMQEIFKNLQIKTFIYTNDLDLTFTQKIK